MNFPKVNLKGMGGKEKELNKLWPEFTRVNAALYDFIDESTGIKYEVKKCSSTHKSPVAFIDPTKFLDLEDGDREIIFRWVIFDQETGECLEIIDTTLGEIIDRFVKPECSGAFKKLEKEYPGRSILQIKLRIKWWGEISYK